MKHYLTGLIKHLWHYQTSPGLLHEKRDNLSGILYIITLISCCIKGIISCYKKGTTLPYSGKNIEQVQLGSLRSKTSCYLFITDNKWETTELLPHAYLDNKCNKHHVDRHFKGNDKEDNNYKIHLQYSINPSKNSTKIMFAIKTENVRTANGVLAPKQLPMKSFSQYIVQSVLVVTLATGAPKNRASWLDPRGMTPRQVTLGKGHPSLSSQRSF